MPRGEGLPARAGARPSGGQGPVRPASCRCGDDPALIHAFYLGEGFTGEACRLLRPREIHSISFDELRDRSPFDLLKKVEGELSHGQVLAGYLGYECAMAVEPGLSLPPPPLPAPAAWFAVFDEAEPIAPAGLPRPDHLPSPVSTHPGDDAARYAAKVQDVRERIARGDVFQVNVSHLQSARFETGPGSLGDILPWHDALEARYGAFIDLGGTGVISASPELFLSLRGRRLASEPIKGTRPRGSSAEEDRRNAEALLADPKDRAENVMILDLMRNDLAKVCRDGTIREPRICELRSLPSVHHLYSRVEGDLAEGLAFADALRAAFPCGSVTGAPKLAAMKAIAEIEGEGRGVYCGAVFARTRSLGTASVAIRTAMTDEKTRSSHVRSGGGVTILSDPQAEYEEALAKAYLFRHLTGAP